MSTKALEVLQTHINNFEELRRMYTKTALQARTPDQRIATEILIGTTDSGLRALREVQMILLNEGSKQEPIVFVGVP